MTVIESFAAFAVGLDPPAAARAAARRCLIDWWGGALAGPLAALGRPVELGAFAPDALHDPGVRALMPRVELALDEEAEAAFPALRGAEVVVTTRGRGTHRFRQRTRRGDPDFPLSDKEIGEKFHLLAAPVIGADAAAEVAAALGRVEALPRLAAIPMPAAVPPSGG